MTDDRTEEEEVSKTDSIAAVLIEALKKYTQGPEEAIDVITTVVGMLAVMSEEDDKKYPKTSEFEFYYWGVLYRVETSVVKLGKEVDTKVKH